MVRLLTTIPGIGYYYSTILIISEIGDINHFPNSSHLCSYVGLVPSTHSSGGITYHSGITKKACSKYLRWVIIENMFMYLLEIIRILISNNTIPSNEFYLKILSMTRPRGLAQFTYIFRQ